MRGVAKRLPKWFASLLYAIESGVVGFTAVDTAIRLSRGENVNLVLIPIAIILAIHLTYLLWRDLRVRRVNKWTRKAIEFKKHGQYDEALAAFDRVIKLAPEYWLPWNNKANLLNNDLKRYGDALATCDQAIACGVSFVGIWSARGDALHALGREDEALAAYAQAIAVPASNNFISWANKGEALEGLGRYEEALAAYDRALALRHMEQ